jgi:hydroxypyruvate isomerase
MPLKFCANLSFMFQETASLLERYQLAKDVGFRAVECAFPYVHSVDEVVAAQKKAGVEQILINVFVGKYVAVTYPHNVCNVM